MQKLIVNLIESLEVKKINNTISAKSKNFIQQAVKMLEQRGVVLIRNLHDEKLLADIQKTWNINFKRPSVSGTVGYYRTSYAKAVLPLFLLGRPAMKVALEKNHFNYRKVYEKQMYTLLKLMQFGIKQQTIFTFLYIAILLQVGRSQSLVVLV